MNPTTMPPLHSPPPVQTNTADGSACRRQESSATDDPFRAIAEAMEAAAREAASQQRPERPDKPKNKAPRPAAPASAAPATGVGKAAYSVAYGLGFGVAFPAFFVLGLLPPDSAVARGLRDGADAARKSLGE